jgi:hypothetical protein
MRGCRDTQQGLAKQKRLKPLRIAFCVVIFVSERLIKKSRCSPEQISEADLRPQL